MTIEERFEEFHRDNPHVYRLFKMFVGELITAGVKRMSSKAVMERIRWETSIATTKSGAWHVAGKKQCKLNDHYTSRYTRMFSKDFPHLAHRFETRIIKTP